MIYDYRSDKIVQDVIFDDLCPIIEDIEAEFHGLRRDECIGIYAPSFIAKEILDNLFENIDDIFVHKDSEIGLPLDDKCVVLISIWTNGELFIENVCGNDSYLISCGGAINYVYDGFKKKDLDKMIENEDPILVFGLNEEANDNDSICTDNSESTHISRAKDGRLEGFSKSWTTSKNGMTCYSTYSHYSDDENMVKNIARLFEINV